MAEGITQGITGVILTTLTTIFTNELMNDPGLANDPLKLQVIKLYALQDDPTAEAPYLIFGPDPEKSIEHNTEFPPEIGLGAPTHYRHFFFAKCGTPIVTDQVIAYGEIETLTSRVMAVLMEHYDLGGLVSQDYTKRIEGANKLLICNTRIKITGGDSQFFGTGYIHWSYPVSWYP